MKKILIVIISLTGIVLVISITGYFKSGYVIFSGKYDTEILGAFFTMLSALLGPVTSVIAAILFYYSLREQRKALIIQNTELNEMKLTNEKNSENENFNLLLSEIKDLNNNLEVEIQFSKESSTPVKFRGSDVINQLKIFQLNPDYSPKYPDTLTSVNGPILTEYFRIPLGSFVNMDGIICEVVKRPDKEIKYFLDLERKIWILSNSIIELINNSKNKEIQKRILASNLDFQYFEIILGLFNKHDTHPDNKIIYEMIELIK